MPNISLDMTGQVPHLSKQQIMLLLTNKAYIDYTGITGLMDIRGYGYGRVIHKLILLIDQIFYGVLLHLMIQFIDVDII